MLVVVVEPLLVCDCEPFGAGRGGGGGCACGWDCEGVGAGVVPVPVVLPPGMRKRLRSTASSVRVSRVSGLRPSGMANGWFPVVEGVDAIVGVVLVGRRDNGR